MDDEPERCCFDDWTPTYAKRARTRHLGVVSTDLIRGLEEAGLGGRTVLDVGCGAGGLIFETLERGASTATGVDLSSMSVEQARRISRERGLEDRTTFAVGDGSSVPLDPHDVVVLDKVFCCFADADRLLANSLPAARSVYAFSVPPSSGIRGAIARGRVWIENLGYRLRPRRSGGFRARVHDVGKLDAGVRAAGFTPRFQRRRFGWDLAVYAR
ncbi:MAG TPA: class I SAM-dependent methyltransferase [Actinomycetota bacterium]|nr:class I SAM-dependent methyltransferase [Actinomycetota bacterium]